MSFHNFMTCSSSTLVQTKVQTRSPDCHWALYQITICARAQDCQELSVGLDHWHSQGSRNLDLFDTASKGVVTSEPCLRRVGQELGLSARPFVPASKTAASFLAQHRIVLAGSSRESDPTPNAAARSSAPCSQYRTPGTL